MNMETKFGSGINSEPQDEIENSKSNTIDETNFEEKFLDNHRRAVQN